MRSRLQRTSRRAAIERVVTYSDSTGNLHVLAQDASGACWYFAENQAGELWFAGALSSPKRVQPGAIALTEDSDGDLLAFAVAAVEQGGDPIRANARAG